MGITAKKELKVEIINKEDLKQNQECFAKAGLSIALYILNKRKTNPNYPNN